MESQQEIIKKFRKIRTDVLDYVPDFMEGKDIEIKCFMDNDDIINNTVTVQVYEVIKMPKEGC